MNRLLTELHQDHVNFARALHVLGRQFSLLQRGHSADLHVLSQMVDYIQDYPDLEHHPREDFIISVYLERSERGVPLFERMGFEHHLLVEQSEELRSQLERWEYDCPVPRERIALSLRDYLRTQWQHINLEENSIYGLISRTLTADDWERIDATMPAGLDPQFGPMLRQRRDNTLEYAFGHA